MSQERLALHQNLSLEEKPDASRKYNPLVTRRELVQIPARLAAAQVATRLIPLVTTLTACVSLRPEQLGRNGEIISNVQVPPQYLLPAREIETMAEASRLKGAVGSIMKLQQKEGFFQSRSTKDEVIPMDNAHVAMALSKVGYVAEAEAAVDWFLTHLTKAGDKDVTEKIIIDGEEKEVSYVGSWYDQFYGDGTRRKNAARGRGEAVGLTLISIDAICQQHPEYFTKEVNGRKVAEYVGDMVGYLSILQQGNGTFIHRPDYKEAFVEENVRMVLGLDLAQKLLEQAGYIKKAETALKIAKNGRKALEMNKGYRDGMAYDFMARSMWGIGGQEQAGYDLAQARKEKVLDSTGVRAYDWQVKLRKNPFKKSQYWIRGQANGVSETLEGIIVAIRAGELNLAEDYIETIRSLQHTDGSFPSSYIENIGPIPNIGLGAPPIYAAARYIMAELALEDFYASHSTLLRNKKTYRK